MSIGTGDGKEDDESSSLISPKTNKQTNKQTNKIKPSDFITFSIGAGDGKEDDKSSKEDLIFLFKPNNFYLNLIIST